MSKGYVIFCKTLVLIRASAELWSYFLDRKPLEKYKNSSVEEIFSLVGIVFGINPVGAGQPSGCS